MTVAKGWPTVSTCFDEAGMSVDAIKEEENRREAIGHSGWARQYGPGTLHCMTWSCENLAKADELEARLEAAGFRAAKLITGSRTP